MSWNGFVRRMGCEQSCVSGLQKICSVGIRAGPVDCQCTYRARNICPVGVVGYVLGRNSHLRRLAMWVASAMSNPWSVGMHSVLDTRSLAFVLTFQSLPSAIMKSVDRWVARRLSAGVSPAESPRRWRTMGWKKMSFMNWRSRGCFWLGDSETLKISLTIPLLASQSARMV